MGWLQGAFQPGTRAISCATAAVSFLAYGTCRNSFGPCALLLGPSTPQTIICAFGKPWLSMPMSGIVPPCPIVAQGAPKKFCDASFRAFSNHGTLAGAFQPVAPPLL